MRTYSGPFLTQNGFIQVEITVKGGSGAAGIWGESQMGKIVDFEEGGDQGREVIIIPSMFNAHTHMADSIVKSPPEGDIAELVGPGGFKEEALSNADEDELIASIKRFIEEMLESGVRDAMEFREGGIDGIRLLQSAAKEIEEDFYLRIMARPSERAYDEWELNKILTMADGLGISSYSDWDQDQLKRIADAAENMNKPLAVHCSEEKREPLDKVLDLHVHHLVHMIEATTDDLITCAIEDVPVVVCPRANMHFGKIPDIPAMLEAGITMALGTDNAMLSWANMFREMETAYRVSKLNGGSDPLDILMMATWNPRKVLNLPSSIGGQKSKDNYLILEYGSGEPAYEVVTRRSSRQILDIVEW